MNYLIVISVFLLIFLSSCCTKKECDGFDDSTLIYLKGFSQEELDTVLLYVYDKEDGFSKPIDSMQYFSSSVFSVHLKAEMEYKFILSGKAGVFRLHGFETSKEGCNQCFPYHPKTDFFTKLNAYYVNGVRKSGGSKIEIEKG